MNNSPEIELLNIDCMDYMRGCADKQFELAIVDPPYGKRIGSNGKIHNNKKFTKGFKKEIDYGNVKWDDNIPNDLYFSELKRISKNQIIWGGNFFLDFLGNTRCVIVWDKRGKDKNPHFSPFELAWTSFNALPKIFEYGWLGFGYINSDETKIHPTQKPISLYKWLLKHYAKPGDKIFDSHLGSGSIAIACWDMGFDLVGCEIDKDYYDAMMRRYKEHISQLTLF